jgi:hypothetical protein
VIQEPYHAVKDAIHKILPIVQKAKEDLEKVIAPFVEIVEMIGEIFA